MSSCVPKPLSSSHHPTPPPEKCECFTDAVLDKSLFSGTSTDFTFKIANFVIKVAAT